MKFLDLIFDRLIWIQRRKTFAGRFFARISLGFAVSLLLAAGVSGFTASPGFAQVDADAPVVQREARQDETELNETRPNETLPDEVRQDNAEVVKPELDAQAAEAAEATAESTVIVTAPVDINGRRLFRVAKASDISAERRAAEITQKFDQLDITDSVPTVEVRQEEGSPTLWLQQGDTELYLMTVTSLDATPSSPDKVADIWAENLRTGLKETHRELTSGTEERLVSALGILGITLGVQFLLVRLWRWGRQRLIQLMGSSPDPDKDEDHHQLLNLTLKILLLSILGWLWISALLYAANLFPITRELSNALRDRITETLTAPLIPIGDGYSLLSCVLLAILLVATIIAAGALTDLLRSRFLNALGISIGIQEAIAIVFKYCFITLGFVIALQLWGIDLSSLAIFASALSVGIGFGLQDIAKNLGSGLVLVFERPIQVGDFVEVGDYIGTIEKLSARSTRIRTMDDLTVFVPNSRFLEEEVTNWSHHRTPSRIKIPVGVAYGSDLEAVKEALLEATEDQKTVLKAPKPQVLFMGFGDSSLDFVLMVWIARPQLHVRIKSELNFKIDAAFRARNIEIPFPQRDLHLRSGDLPILLNGKHEKNGKDKTIALQE